ncbi:50S ribosomal protein L23 [bacterium]|nr:50S ribosomal protein L23 [bacterium]
MGLFGKKKDKKEVSKSDEKDLTIDEIQRGKSVQSKSTSKTQKKDSKKSKAHSVSKKDTKNSYKILVKPLVTEKASYLKSENKYVFEVASEANKAEVKRAIYHVYGYWPKDVHIIRLSGKKVKYGKTKGTTRAKKKAIVTLKKGDSIEIYEGV